jgi:hypothetical protein
MATERMTAIVGARISEFRRKMAEVNAIAKKVPRKIVTEVDVRVDKFQKKMDRLAKTINSFSTVGGNIMRGGMFAALPAISPAIAGVGAVIGGVGPMIGVMTGGLLGLASAFVAAGAGVGGFAAIAIPSINGVTKANSDLNGMQKKTQQYLASGEMKKYNEQLKKIQDYQNGLTKSQKESIKTLRDFKKFYGDFSKQFQDPVLDVFNNSMETAKGLLKSLGPTIMNATNAIAGLLDSFNKSLKAKDVKGIFKWLESSAGPAISALGEGFGYMTRGILNMLAAFQPLATDVQNGFLGMMKGFSEWAAGLSKSEKFNQFMNYVRTNGPKLLSIFGNITTGLVNMFSAFGPMSSDMMSGLVDMTASFKKWATGLKNSESFKKFIDYVKTNGPTMLSVIGQIVLFIGNLLEGMAPLGAKIMVMANSFLTWANNMMNTYPIIGQIIAAVLSVVGVLTMMIPFIIGWQVAFGGAAKFIWTATGMMRAKFITGISMMIKSIGKFILNVIKMTATFLVQTAKMLAKAVVWAARMAVQWLIAMGPIGWIIAAVIALVALIIWKWDEIKKATILIWKALVIYLKTKWNEAKRATAIIWKAITAYIKSNVKEIWNKIKETFNDIVSFITGLGSTFYDAGKGLIDQMAKGIKNAAGWVIDQVKSLANKIRGFLPFSPAKEGPLSDINKLNFGGPIGDSIAKAKGAVQSSLRSMLQVPDISVGMNPALAGSVAAPSTPTRYDTKDRDITSAIASALESMVLDNRIEIDGNEVIKATGKPMMRYIDQESKSAGRRVGVMRNA